MVQPAIPVVLTQHLEDAAVLRGVRGFLVCAPHVRMLHLGRNDDRLAAHLDGLQLAGEDAERLCLAALEKPDVGVLFVGTVLAILRLDVGHVDRLLGLIDVVPEASRALVSAFGWVEASQLRGLVSRQLTSESTTARRLGIAACVVHRVDPGQALADAIEHPDLRLKQCALRAAGDLGRQDLLPSCLRQMVTGAPAQTVFCAARSAVLLGNRQEAVQALKAMASQAGPCQVPALQLVLKVLAADQANALLKPLSQDPASVRALIRGAGMAGDPHYVPWLIKQMSDLKLTRLAGESFSLITGLDLAFVDLDCKPPEKLEFGPNDDPADADVAMDEDDSLPWPDPEKIAAWWAAHGARFKPGTRYFVGEPPSVAHCRSVLRGGFQRQRISAAEYLCLLAPGTPLFNTAAPAWRQERLLAQMEA